MVKRRVCCNFHQSYTTLAKQLLSSREVRTRNNSLMLVGISANLVMDGEGEWQIRLPWWATKGVGWKMLPRLCDLAP